MQPPSHEVASVTPKATSTPAATSSLVPTQRPPTIEPTVGPTVAPADAQLMPDSTGTSWLEKRSIEIDDLFSGSLHGRAETAQFLDEVGATRDGFHGVIGHGNGIDLLVIRVDGVDADDLGSAFIRGMESEDELTILSRRFGGNEAKEIRRRNDNLRRVTTIMAARGRLFVATVSEDWYPLGEAILGRLFEPRLDLMLPDSVRGAELSRYSMPGVVLSGGGDVCSFVCPGEPKALVDALGVGIERLDMAVAYSQQRPILVVAFQVEGVSASRMLSARSGHAFARRALTIAGKSVLWIQHDALGSSFFTELLYAREGVVFSVRPAPDSPGNVSAETEEAIRSLP